MNTVKRPFVDSSVAIEIRAHAFHVDASTLGLRPGEWPAALDTNLGNGQRFVRDGFRYEGEACLYRQELGALTLLVLND